MKRNEWFPILVLGMVIGSCIAFVVSAHTVAQAAPRIEAATATVGAEFAGVAYMNDGSQYGLVLIAPSLITPTRIFTPTPLVEGTNTATPRATVAPTSTRTATTAAGLCKDYTVTANPALLVRAGPGKKFAVLTSLPNGATVALSLLAADKVTDADNITWRKVCLNSAPTGDPEAWVSQGWVIAK